MLRAITAYADDTCCCTLVLHKFQFDLHWRVHTNMSVRGVASQLPTDCIEFTRHAMPLLASKIEPPVRAARTRTCTETSTSVITPHEF